MSLTLPTFNLHGEMLHYLLLVGDYLLEGFVVSNNLREMARGFIMSSSM